MKSNHITKLVQTLLLSLAVFALTGAGDPASRFKEIGHQLMCICSCNQILLECNHVGCPDSDGMRNELMAAVTRGDSDSLVQQSFVQKYGPTVLAAPTTSKRAICCERSMRRRMIFESSTIMSFNAGLESSTICITLPRCHLRAWRRAARSWSSG